MKSRIFITRIIYTFIIIAIIAVFYFMVNKALNPIKTIYSVSAVTEKAKCQIKDIGGSSFNIYQAIVYDENDKVVFKEFTGNFRFYNSAIIECERLSNGPFIVTIYNDSLGSVGGVYKDENLVYKSKNRIVFVFTKLENLFNQGKSIVIPISGKIESGEDVAGQVEGITSPILREGTVTLAGYSKLSSSYFNAGTEQLFMGDRLIFENDTVSAIGFIQVSEEPAFKIAYRVEAEQAKILKPGPRDINSGYVFSATIYDQLLHDKVFQSISLVGALLALVATLGSFLMDILKFRYKEHE